MSQDNRPNIFGNDDHSDWSPPSMWGDESTPSPIVTSVVQEERGGNRLRRPRIGRKTVAVVLSLAGVAGVGATVASVMGDRSPDPAAPISAEPFQPSVEAGSALEAMDKQTPPSAVLVSEFEQILINDGCDPKINAQEAAQIYHDTFEVDLEIDNSYESLKSAVAEMSERTEEARSKVEFVKLPEAYQKLLADSQSEQPQIDLKTYEDTLKTYLASAGMETYFEWSQPTTIEEFISLPRPEEASPVSLANRDNPLTRQVIVQTMQGVAQTPKEVIDTAKVKKLYLGEIVDQEHTAHTAFSGEFATKEGPAERFVVDLTPSDQGNWNPMGHEYAHAWQGAVCAEFTDLAWQNTNPDDFKYDNKLPDGTLDPNTYPDLSEAATSATLDGPSVVLREYGDESAKEDFATSIGETLFDPTNSEVLFVTPENTDVLYKKITLFIARTAETNPELASYYQALMHAANLEQQVNKQLTAAMSEKHATESIKINGQPQTEKIAEAEAIVKQYEELAGQIQLAQTPHLTPVN